MSRPDGWAKKRDGGRRDGGRWFGGRWFRRLTVLFVILVPVVAIAGLITLRDLRAARRDLVLARTSLVSVMADPAALETSVGRAGARQRIDRATTMVAGAHRRTERSPVLKMMRFLPGIGTQRAGLLRLMDDIAKATVSGRRLLDTADRLEPSMSINGGRLPLAGLGSLEAEVRESAGELGRLSRDPTGLRWPVRGARTAFNSAAKNASARLASAADALGATRSFLGAEGDRRYLVALQNNAEMRAQGMVLSYLSLRFTAGQPVIEQSGSVADLQLKGPVPVELPPGTAQVFGPLQPTQLWQSVNATADFALSGRLMAAMFRQSTGKVIDGVIAIDVPGLGELLRQLGPVSIEGTTEPVTADNIGRILLHDLYSQYDLVSDQQVRHDLLQELATTVFGRLFESGADAVSLGRGLGTAAAGRHLRLWSATPAEETVFERVGLGGGPAAEDGDHTYHVAIENRTANKVDYFIKPRIRMRVIIDPSGSAIVRTTISIENQAPVGAPPSYQLSSGLPNFEPGDYMAWALAWLPPDSLDQTGGVKESGLVVTHSVFEVKAGQRREVTFDGVVRGAVRDGRFEMRIVPQPRLEPVPIEVEVEAQGWQVEGERRWEGSLNRTQNLAWQLKRK